MLSLPVFNNDRPTSNSFSFCEEFNLFFSLIFEAINWNVLAVSHLTTEIYKKLKFHVIFIEIEKRNLLINFPIVIFLCYTIYNEFCKGRQISRKDRVKSTCVSMKKFQLILKKISTRRKFKMKNTQIFGMSLVNSGTVLKKREIKFYFITLQTTNIYL